MAEYSANAIQTVNPGESIIFTDVVNPCNRNLVRFRPDTGNFLLSGWTPNYFCANGCRKNKNAVYLVDFGANISIPTGGTVEPISIAMAIDGTTVAPSTMIVTPAATNQYFNVSRAINADIWNNCCQTVSIRNTSSQPIQVQNANIIFSRPDLVVSR